MLPKEHVAAALAIVQLSAVSAPFSLRVKTREAAGPGDASRRTDRFDAFVATPGERIWTGDSLPPDVLIPLGEKKLSAPLRDVLPVSTEAAGPGAPGCPCGP